VTWRSWQVPVRPFAIAPSEHRPALDGVRGIAILTVFLYDCLKLPPGGPFNLVLRKASAMGWIGVDLFFVLSGFLITGILLDSRGKPGYLSSFFARRALRIFPLYFLALWAAFIALPQLAEAVSSLRPAADNMRAFSSEQVWFWTYLQNWRFAWQGRWPDVGYLNHFWSLAVEEQFYLVWPFIVGWLGRGVLARVCWGLVVTALALRASMWIAGAPSVTLYVTTITRMDSLCLGALFAMALRSEKWYRLACRFAVPTLLVLAVLIAGVDAVWPILKTQTAGAQTIGHTLLGLAFGCFVLFAAAASPEHWSARALSSRVLTVPGQYSYAMYVLHRPVYKAVQKLNWSWAPDGMQPYMVFAAALGGSLACAALSWRFFEKPFLALKGFFPRPGEGTPAVREEPRAVCSVG
jgi:peptidoglycan/LPS O-acetylase OafA/YrhL